jgi:outer membrane protein assembly factor BamB
MFTLVLLIGLGSGPAAESADWPEFRGPTGQGLVRNAKLLTVWSPTKNVAWKQEIPGSGWSSPIVSQARIYLTSSVPVEPTAANDQSLRALCLDATTGKILWQREVFHQNGATAPPIHTKNSHASPTPLIQDGRLYVHFGHQGTACLDLTGNVLWRNKDLTYLPAHGNGGSPILFENALIFSSDGRDERFIAALDRKNGQVLWKTERQGDTDRKFSFSTPLIITVKGQKQLISPGSDSVNAYDPQTGQEIWRVRYDGYSVIPRPVYGHGLVFIATGYNTPSLLAIRPDGQGDVTDTHVEWTQRMGAPHTPSPLLLGEELYMVSDNGTASCLDARTGKAHWQRRLGGAYSASPIAADGKIYFQSEEGLGVVLEASKKFKQVARNDLKEQTLASYAVADGALFIRTQKHLYRIQER